MSASHFRRYAHLLKHSLRFLSHAKLWYLDCLHVHNNMKSRLISLAFLKFIAELSPCLVVVLTTLQLWCRVVTFLARRQKAFILPIQHHTGQRAGSAVRVGRPKMELKTLWTQFLWSSGEQNHNLDNVCSLLSLLSTLKAKKKQDLTSPSHPHIK